MARICVFCGKELGVFERDTLLAGNVSQPACKKCWNLLFELPQEERGRLALETGRAVDPEKIMASLEQYREREAKKAKARESLLTGEKCLRCGGPMERCGRKILHLGEEGLFGPVARDGLFASWLEVDVHRCAQCGRGEFYLPEPPEIPEFPRETEEVTCPVCGTRHSPDIGCPHCAMSRGSGADGEQEHWSAGTSGEKKKSYRKPPWEK